MLPSGFWLWLSFPTGGSRRGSSQPVAITGVFLWICLFHLNFWSSPSLILRVPSLQGDAPLLGILVFCSFTACRASTLSVSSGNARRPCRPLQHAACYHRALLSVSVFCLLWVRAAGWRRPWREHGFPTGVAGRWPLRVQGCTAVPESGLALRPLGDQPLPHLRRKSGCPGAPARASLQGLAMLEAISKPLSPGLWAGQA